MITDIDSILDALKATVEEIDFDPQPSVFIDEPQNLKPASVVLVLEEIERTALTVADSELGSYDWTLIIQAQVFFEITSAGTAGVTKAQRSARKYVESLIRAIDTDSNLALVLTDDPRVTHSERVGPTQDNGDQERVFEAWTAQIELPALISY